MYLVKEEMLIFGYFYGKCRVAIIYNFLILILGLCIISRYIECIDTLATIWLMIYQIKNIDSHDMDQNIFLAIQSSVLLHFYQFIPNIIHIWFCQIYRKTYHVSFQSVDNTIHIRLIFRYRALIDINNYIIMIYWKHDKSSFWVIQNHDWYINIAINKSMASKRPLSNQPMASNFIFGIVVISEF